MRQINNVQRVVRAALGQAKNTTVSPLPKWATTVHTAPAPRDVVETSYTTPPGQPELQRHPQSQPELQRHPSPRRYTVDAPRGGETSPPRDIITSFPMTVPGPTNPPIPPCGPSPCCRQYDWRWWNTAKI